ncbi:MAG: multiheme c-type cytochrome ExtKL [Geobacteraceae bacterium]|nr:multiheme c-type cytochrome ExtKL [Geobacteraceae bacterium]
MKTFILILILLLLPLAARGEYKTLGELVRAYDDKPCQACHRKIHDEWRQSAHSRSMVESLGITRDFIVAIGRDWHKPVTREQLMRCMECHAPQMEEASEEVTQEVAGLVVTAVEGADEKARAGALASLGKLSVTCIVCHNTRAVIEQNAGGAAEKGVFHGPAGNPSPAHGTRKSAALASPLFCGQCHRTYTPPDREIVFCSSLYESYQDGYRAGGGTQRCQDCHIQAKGRGHRMPGSHDPELVQEGLVLEASARGIRVQPKKWLPAAVLEVSVSNRAGHRTPDG